MVDYFQNSIAANAVGTPGLVVREALADIESALAVEPASIGLGIVVSRGTDPEKQVVIGGDASPDIIGITCRIANASGALGAEATNPPLFAQYETIPVIRKGYVWVTCSGTGVAGSRNISYNDTTGAIVLGTAGVGETQLDPLTVELMNTVTGGEVLCLLRLTDLRVDTWPVIEDDHIRAECLALPVQTDEAEVTGVLNGAVGKAFAPSEVVLVVASETGATAKDGTINVGTTTGGSDILSAQALTNLDDAGDTLRIPLAEADTVILGNATIYANVEAADSTTTTLVLNVYVLGRQFDI